MSQTFPTEHCESILESIELSLTAELTESRRRETQLHLVDCDFCAEALENASVVHATFQRADAPRCPDHVVDAILESVEQDAKIQPLRRGRNAPRRFPIPVWMASGLAAAIVLFAVLVPGRDPALPPVAEEPTPAEVAAAALEMQHAFAVVSRSLSRTTGIIDQEVRGRMTDPLLHSLERGGIHRVAPKPSANEQQTS